MSLSINPYGLNMANANSSNIFGNNTEHTSKIIVNGKSIDMKSKEQLLPPYLREIREKNAELKYSNTMLKVQNGQDLSPAELATIKEKNPDLYRELMEEIRFQKQFEEQLRHCKSREEAQTAYTNTQLTVAKLCGSSTGTSIPADQQEKYNRMINRISKSFEKYLSGKLNSNPSETPNTNNAFAQQTTKAPATSDINTLEEINNALLQTEKKSKRIDDYLPGDNYDSLI